MGEGRGFKFLSTPWKGLCGVQTPSPSSLSDMDTEDSHLGIRTTGLGFSLPQEYSQTLKKIAFLFPQIFTHSSVLSQHLWLTSHNNSVRKILLSPFTEDTTEDQRRAGTKYKSPDIQSDDDSSPPADAEFPPPIIAWGQWFSKDGLRNAQMSSRPFQQVFKVKAISLIILRPYSPFLCVDLFTNGVKANEGKTANHLRVIQSCDSTCPCCHCILQPPGAHGAQIASFTLRLWFYGNYSESVSAAPQSKTVLLQKSVSPVIWVAS